MLVSAKEMLDKAVEGHYAVGQFNINNLVILIHIHHSFAKAAFLRPLHFTFLSYRRSYSRLFKNEGK